MAALSIRRLDDEVRDALRARAVRNGRSMEAEVRSILAAAVCEFADVGGVEVEMPPGATLAGVVRPGPDHAQDREHARDVPPPSVGPRTAGG